GAGLGLVSHSLGADGDAFDDDIFSMLDEKHVPIANVLEHGLPDRRSAQAYLRRLFKSDRVADVERTWSWIVARRHADDKLANEYTEYCVNSKQLAAAANGWALYAKGRSANYLDRNRIFNGDFEFDPSGNRFDWHIEPRSGIAIDFDESVRTSGHRSLRIRFDGTQNASEIGVGQTIFLPAGRYQLQARVKTQ